MCVIRNTTPINLDKNFTNSIQRLASTNCSSDPQHSFRRRGSLQLLAKDTSHETWTSSCLQVLSLIDLRPITGNGQSNRIIEAEYIHLTFEASTMSHHFRTSQCFRPLKTSTTNQHDMQIPTLSHPVSPTHHRQWTNEQHDSSRIHSNVIGILCLPSSNSSLSLPMPHEHFLQLD